MAGAGGWGAWGGAQRLPVSEASGAKRRFGRIVATIRESASRFGGSLRSSRCRFVGFCENCKMLALLTFQLPMALPGTQQDVSVPTIPMVHPGNVD